ncbi:MAG: hypothetical protein HDS50_03405 [Bacteroides sp.]|nr:hypothetical protein [Bacteroides sp.]
MNTKVYVNGCILIKTPFFKYSAGGCYYEYPPDGADIINPDSVVDGHKCLVITEDKAPSFFKEYYAREEFTTYSDWAPFFDLTIDKCFSSFEEKLSEVVELLKNNDVHVPTRQNLYRLALLSAVAALDTLISDLILFISTKDRSCFLKIIGHLGLNSKKCFQLMTRINKMWCDNAIDSAEQNVISLILRKSYSSIEDIKDILKDIYGISVSSSEDLKEIIEMRHLIAHRNGRRKDGTNIDLTKDALIAKIGVIRDFSEQLKQKLVMQTGI